ncbi:MAG: hypothetical protein ACXWIP_16420 [Burkholderiales bacterium]
MRQSKAARKRQVKDVTLGVLALLFFVTAVVGGGFYAMSREPSLDRTTLCPGTGPTGHIVLLVDKTDPLNFTQKQAFLRLLEDLIDRRVSAGQLVSVYVLEENYREAATPLVEVCNPGRGEGKSELTANMAKLRAQFGERFREPLLKQADILIGSAPTKTSPILEMVQLVAINAFRKHAVNGSRRLIIVSDMMHNTAPYSMYHGVYDYPLFKSSDYGRKMQTDLAGVEVELHYVLHSPKLQTRRQLKFWEDYFSSSGARIVAVKAIEG